MPMAMQRLWETLPSSRWIYQILCLQVWHKLRKKSKILTRQFPNFLQILPPTQLQSNSVFQHRISNQQVIRRHSHQNMDSNQISHLGLKTSQWKEHRLLYRWLIRTTQTRSKTNLALHKPSILLTLKINKFFNRKVRYNPKATMFCSRKLSKSRIQI